MSDRPGFETEREALLAVLAGQRAHVLQALDGLPDGALRRPVLPSGWTCLGMVQHLALDVERFWFRTVVAGEQLERRSGDEAWRVSPETPPEAVLETYREEIRRADAVIGGTALDAAPVWWPDELFRGMPVRALRGTILHVITETACHAGTSTRRASCSTATSGWC